MRCSRILGVAIGALATGLGGCPSDDGPALRRFEELPAEAPKKPAAAPAPLREFDPSWASRKSAVPGWALAERADGGAQETPAAASPEPEDAGAEIPAPCDSLAWVKARPGDWVEYRLDEAPSPVLRAEVAAIERGTVWVLASAHGADGGVLTMPGGGAAELLVPFAPELGPWRPLVSHGNVRVPVRTAIDEDAIVLGDVPKVERAADVEIGGRSLPAIRETLDHRAVRGPKVVIVRTSPDGPLYLTRGVLSWEAWAAGAPRAGLSPSQHARLSLAALGSGPAPVGLQALRKYAPAPWEYVRQAGEPVPGPSPGRETIVVTGIGQGLLARWHCNSVAAGEAVQPQAERCTIQPRVWDLLELLRELAGQGTAGRWQGIQQRAAPVSVPLRLGTGPVEVVQLGDGLYARDPWAEALSGAPWDLRYGRLGLTDDQVGRVLGWSTF